MQNCSNTRGSYTCSCDDFFKVDPNNPKKCIAEKPCSSGHGCEHVCFKGKNNEPKCTCNANYELESDGESCRDIDECDPSNSRHRCSHICTNKPGGYQCSCVKGFELAKNGYDCEDINECLDVDSFNCTDEFHKCVNTRGSYKCECEQDLYFINGKCRALEKNETVPEPELPKPREPSNKEKKEAVQFSIEPTNENFLALIKYIFIQFYDLETTSILNYTSLRQAWTVVDCNSTMGFYPSRSLLFDLYTKDQIHLMPGYPRNSSGLLQIAFYIQQPAGQYVGNASVLPQRILIEIIRYHESDIETAIGANISDIEAWFKPTAPPSVGTAKPDDKQWKWIIIGVSVGAVVLIVIVSFVAWKCQKKKDKRVVIPADADDTPQQNITMKSFHQSVENLQLAPNQ
ncbi:mucin-like protein [Stylophora pistillata]|uniref:mucin-like protein n=1 Tax=Stylophora pistillata TaxID=50429 RepID=UPI000C04E4E9|nr:mucin-like protein [Stylophora pistillata]